MIVGAIAIAAAITGCDSSEGAAPTSTESSAARIITTNPTTTGTASTVTSTRAAAHSYERFSSPTGNIHCIVSTYTKSGFVRCDVTSPTYQAPPKPAECGMGPWASSVILEGLDKARFNCHSDTVADPSNPVLAYGESTTRLGFTCASAQDGITCKSGQTGYGFRIARDSYDLS